MDSYGWRGMIYDVAQSGAMGSIAEVEKSKLYSFMNYLAYMKSQQKYDELAAARIEAKSKAGRKN